MNNLPLSPSCSLMLHSTGSRSRPPPRIGSRPHAAYFSGSAPLPSSPPSPHSQLTPHVKFGTLPPNLALSPPTPPSDPRIVLYARYARPGLSL